MKRQKKASAILTSDWHIRETIPICRTDNYFEAQWKKIDFVSIVLQKEHNCPVIHAGDLFDHWKPSPALLSETIKHLPDQFYSIYGNHDLPQHSLELKEKCGVFTLQVANKVSIPTINCDIPESGTYPFNIYGCSWNEQPIQNTKGVYNILVWHIFNYQGKEPWPGCTDPTSKRLLRKYPEYQLILTGDNHQSFIEKYDNRILLNPGSLMRMDADQLNFEPKVFLWYCETNEIEPVLIPFEKDVINRNHIELKEQRDNRISAFINKLNTDFTISILFKENLKQFEKKNQIRESVMQIIYKSIEI